MNIYSTQKNIVDQLNAAFTAANLACEALDLPENDADFKKAVPNPLAFVIYTGSNPAGSVSTRGVAQRRPLKFSIELHGRWLYKQDAGMFWIRDVLEQAIIGFAPINCEPITLISDSITQTEDKVWVHVYNVECLCMLVGKDPDDPIIVPSFKELNLTDNL